ncbi:hypothetical protein DMB77_09785 [Staphylococcus saccharolyticus]|nr:hypothetical protein DMB77_09785 [Staphylococcus saccharolyticus]
MLNPVNIGLRGYFCVLKIRRKVNKGEYKKGMMIYLLRNAQNIVFQAKYTKNGKKLGEKDYPISELTTVDLN